jgi:hypothetical protein
MTVQVLMRLAIIVLLITNWNDMLLLAWGQGVRGLSRWDRNSPSAVGLPKARPSGRRWQLYFPPDWRHPAIVRPPVKVYLDPPYGWEDPFRRNGGTRGSAIASQPSQHSSVDNSSSKRAVKQRKRPEVLEFNPKTGRLEKRTVSRSDPYAALETETGSISPPAKTIPDHYRDLQRWDNPPPDP